MTGSTIFNRQISGSDQKKTNEKGQGQPGDGRKPEDEPCSPVFLSMENAVPEVIEQSSKPSNLEYDSGTEDHSEFDGKSGTPGRTLSENDEDEAKSVTLDPEEIHHYDASEQGYATGYQQTHNENQFIEDLNLAHQVKDEDKKDFCDSTKVVFHAEFVLKILGPIVLRFNDVIYYLFAEDEAPLLPISYPTGIFIVTDNAKGQFKCESCGHSWTSMRSRILFHITNPSPCSFISLKIFGQKCQICSTLTYPLWYLDEVSRVMTNLAKIIFWKFFPDLLQEIYGNEIQPIQNGRPRKPYDPRQRNGKMKGPHNSWNCEACRVGCCYIAPCLM